MARVHLCRKKQGVKVKQNCMGSSSVHDSCCNSLRLLRFEWTWWIILPWFTYLPSGRGCAKILKRLLESYFITTNKDSLLFRLLRQSKTVSLRSIKINYSVKFCYFYLAFCFRLLPFCDSCYACSMWFSFVFLVLLGGRGQKAFESIVLIITVLLFSPLLLGCFIVT